MNYATVQTKLSNLEAVADAVEEAKKIISLAGKDTTNG